MTDKGESFVARWSRLKRTGAAETEETPMEEVGGQQNPPVPVDREGEVAGHEAEGEDLPDLPAIDDLTKDSDFSAFMDKRVPDELRNQALRKLWTSDPVLANLDGLLEYGEDFAEPFRQTAGKAVATLWRIGQGMPDPVKEAVQQVLDGEPEAPRTPEEPDVVAEAAPEEAAEEPAAAEEPERPA